MSEYAKFLDEVRKEAVGAGLMVWEDVPGEVPYVDLPAGSTAKDLCQAAVKLAADVIYVYLHEEADAEFAVTGFAKHGIFHRILRAAPPVFLEDEDDEHSEGSEWYPLLGGLITYDNLDARQRALVDAVIGHPDYDPHNHQYESSVLSEVLAEVDDEEFDVLKDAAESRFFEKIGRSIETAASRAAAKLIVDDRFDPLWDEEATERWVSRKHPKHDARTVRRTVSELRSLALSTGLWEAANEELVRQAEDVLAALPAALRDRLGFATRVAARTDLLEPYLKGIPAERHDSIVYWAYRIESEEHGTLREQRYATAAAILVEDYGEKRAAVGRILGLSNSVMERIRREHPTRIDIAGDEVLADLDSRLA